MVREYVVPLDDDELEDEAMKRIAWYVCSSNPHQFIMHSIIIKTAMHCKYFCLCLSVCFFVYRIKLHKRQIQDLNERQAKHRKDIEHA